MSSMYINELQDVANRDVAALKEAEKNYGDSWKKRGGVGAFMMLARKWDRLENRVKTTGYDVFLAVINDERPEGVIDDIRDLRRYLMLVEAELVVTGRCPGQLAKDIERGDASKGSSMAIILEGAPPLKDIVYRAQGGNGLGKSPRKLDTLEELAMLRNFKAYTHMRLDNMGVPYDPNPAGTETHGCRISGRLDWVAANIRYPLDTVVKEGPPEKDDTPGAGTLHPR